ncbi:hypothetical protein QJQ45_030158 [Haematococcus lacustris]|nr:hypothetical protein QJQ45_030158 [Haematococcus lacustris]
MGPPRPRRRAGLAQATAIRAKRQQLLGAQQHLALDQQQLALDQQQLQGTKRQLTLDQEQLQDAQHLLPLDQQQLHGAQHQLHGAQHQITLDQQQLQDAQHQLSLNQQQLQGAQHQLAVDQQLLRRAQQQITLAQQQQHGAQQLLALDLQPPGTAAPLPAAPGAGTAAPPPGALGAAGEDGDGVTAHLLAADSPFVDPNGEFEHPHPHHHLPVPPPVLAAFPTQLSATTVRGLYMCSCGPDAPHQARCCHRTCSDCKDKCMKLKPGVDGSIMLYVKQYAPVKQKEGPARIELQQFRLSLREVVDKLNEQMPSYIVNFSSD